jgi:cysteine-rich repeat protein
MLSPHHKPAISRPGFAVLVSLLAVGCLDSSVVTCEDGRVCAGETVCDEAHDGCVLAEQLETCEDRAQGAACRYRGVPSGACREGVCLPSGCGNGVLDAQEVCDDGNRIHGDGCSGDCRSDETCGNGVVDITVGESCERVSERDGASCRPDCVSMRCGDGVLDRDAHEVCDEGAANSLEPAAACRPNCQPRRCGDNVRDPGEVCDDGNTRGADGCSAECDSDERCGNGIVDTAAGESCEPTGPTDRWCRATCDVVRCGDGIRDREAFEACDEGAENSDEPNASCRPNCQPRRCGDGVRDSDELCDDGNLANGDGCSHDCQSLERCGNGYRDLDEGEECDDANLLSHDGCSSTCRTEAPRWEPVDLEGYFIHPLDGCATYDAARGRFVSYCPDGLGRVRLAELDFWSWRSLPLSGTRPATTGKLVWDGARRVTLLFRSSEDGSGVGETWAWNGAAWRKLTPLTASPPNRDSPALVYDAGRERVVFYAAPRPDEQLAGTWEWDGRDWTPVETSAAPPPGTHSATYDPVRGRVALFDGTELWSYDGESWSIEEVGFAEPTAIGVRFALVFDARARELLLVDAEGSIWKQEGGSWVEVAVNHDFFPGLDGTVLYSPHHQRVFHLGGGSEVSLLEDGAWLSFEARSMPLPRLSGHSLSYEPMSGMLLMFDGDRDETWIWDGFGWQQEFRARPSPGIRAGHATTHEGPSGRIILFGGVDQDNNLASGTWAWTLEGWQELEVAREPPPRRSAAMAYDVANREVILHGGQDRRDVWRLSEGRWSEVAEVPTPHAQFFHGLTYDGARERMVLVGSGAWEWDGLQWEAFETAGPGVRYRHGLAYNPQRRRTMLYGGDHFGPIAWEWNGTWEPVPETVGAQVTVQRPNTFTYDAPRARMIVVEAESADSTWEFAYTAPGEPEEVCRFGFDTDGDGKVGCDDPDCWPFCAPLCPPGSTCDASLPHCGDGVCNEHLETCRMCPEDCSCDAVCGDFFCDAGETAGSCPGDCH